MWEVEVVLEGDLGSSLAVVTVTVSLWMVTWTLWS
jgi:hypothetical protein